MSGESRRPGGWLLPVAVVLVGAYFLYTGVQQGTLKPVALKGVNWAGLALMLAGAVAAIAGGRRQWLRLLGVLACGVGAILVICI